MQAVSFADGYRAAHENAVYVDRSDLGMLKLSGATRLDLIHRMSTQDVARLASGEGSATILTTDIGRIIDRLILYSASETVYAVTSENNSDAVARYLMRYVFFNDDFQLQDLSAETAIFAVYGIQAEAALQQAGFAETDLPQHHWRQQTIDGLTLYLHRTDKIAGDGYFVMAQAGDKAQAAALLAAAGITPIDDATFDYLRIESGVPRFGRELTQDYIPLESGLESDISFTKGCYIGQEVIARMESRGKLAKRLIRLRANEPFEAGSEIVTKGKAVGTITSVAEGPAGVLALGYLKSRAEHAVELSAADVALQRLS